MRNIAALLALVVMACQIAPAHGQLLGTLYAQRSILGTLPQADAKALGKAAAEALSHGEDGTASHWNGPPHPHDNKAVSATIVPARTVTDNGQRCRLLDTRLARAGESEQWKFWFCQTADGKWHSRSLAGR